MISINDTDFKKLTGYIKRHYGINLTAKRTLVEGRLANVIIRKGFNDYSSYLEHIFRYIRQGNEGALNILTTNHTFFMRRQSIFHTYKNSPPYLEESRGQGP